MAVHDDAAAAMPYDWPIGAMGLICVAALGALVASGCVDDGSSTKAGGDAAPSTLRIGTPDARGTFGADQVEDFARRVDELSDGDLQVEPVWEAGVGDDWDQQVARLVVSGELDMGNIPARAWDTEGVTTLQALHAPFLVTTDELLDLVVSDDVADEMLAGLEAIGVTGLVLVPEGLRHVFSYGEPLLTPADFEGTAIRIPTSETSHALFEALGAKPDDFGGIGGGELSAAIVDGTVDAMDSGFGGFIAEVPASITAGNVVPYPKANTLVINAEVFAALTGEQQEAVRDAATSTREWAIANNLDDAARAVAYCRDGGTILVAEERAIDALRRAAQPIYAELGRDETTASMLARINALAERAGPTAPVAPCGPPTVTTSPAVSNETSPEQEPSFPDGVYRAVVTLESLVDAGVDRRTAFDHAGTWTLTFDDGSVITDDDAQAGAVCHGRYDVRDGRVVVTLGDDAGCGDAVGEVLFSAGWELDGDQLQFLDVRSGHGYDALIAPLFGGTPFTRVD